MSDVLVIVPVYNEEQEVVSAILTDLRATGCDVAIVDDGSEPPVPAEMYHDTVRLLRHPVNLGQGAALQTGMEYARRANYQYVVHFDADGQHAAASIADLLLPLRRDEADVIFGSRFIETASRKLIPPVRRVLLRLGRVFNGLSTGLWMTDAHIGLRALNRRAIERVCLRENRMAHATEFLWQLRHHHLRWKEVPVSVVYTTYSRRNGQSFWNAFSIAGDILLRLIYR